MELIQLIATEIRTGTFNGKTPIEMGAAILSLPTELEKVESCHDCGLENTPYFFNKNDCPTCHNTGEIVTPMTLGEVVEEAQNRINEFGPWLLPSGERVRVKGKPRCPCGSEIEPGRPELHRAGMCEKCLGDKGAR